MPILKMKRRTVDNTPPPSLAPGEIAFFLAAGAATMWVGDAAGAPHEYGTDPAGFVKKTGDTMSGTLVLAGDAAPGMELHDTNAALDIGRWRAITESGTLAFQPVRDDGGVMAGGVFVIRNASGVTDMLLSLHGGVAPTAVATTSVVNVARGDARYLRLSGTAAMTGDLTLANSTPSADLHAASKGYVDGLLADYSTTVEADDAYVNADGDTMTGPLTLPSSNPTDDNHATRKSYVDSMILTRMTQSQGDARYSQLGHTHVEEDITNLNRLRYLNDWQAGSYVTNDVVSLDGAIYVAEANTSAVPPAAPWRALGRSGAGVTTADAAPSNPQPGDLWFRTSAPVGMFVWYVDVDSSQWVATDQASQLTEGFVQKTGDTMSGQLTLGAGDPTLAGHAARKAYVDGQIAAVRAGGATAARPASPVTYQSYFDTDLGLPIWWEGVNWVDATGATV